MESSSWPRSDVNSGEAWEEFITDAVYPEPQAKAREDYRNYDHPARETVREFYRAGPAGIPTQTAFSQDTRWPSLDDDRARGCIRSLAHA